MASFDPCIIIAPMIERLGPLPPTIRYRDEFTQIVHQIDDFDLRDDLEFIIDGSRKALRCDSFLDTARLFKHVLLDWMSQHSMNTVFMNATAVELFVRSRTVSLLASLAIADPTTIMQHWTGEIAPNFSVQEARSLKAFLHALCRMHFGEWSTTRARFVSSLPGVPVDKYRVVRAGECFLPLDEQSIIVNYLDELGTVVGSEPSSVDTKTLRDACILIASFKDAFRRKQIAELKIGDVRCWDDGAVHVSFMEGKARENKDRRGTPALRRRMNRRIRREWAPIYAEYLSRRKLESPDTRPSSVPALSLFNLTPIQVGNLIPRVTKDLTETRRTSNSLRHSGIQRVVDGGASRVQVSTFAGHRSLRTARIYFDLSSSHAERVNKALGLSGPYVAVQALSKDRTLDIETLRQLPDDAQIGAVAHGVPIAGIGGCTLGQSLCSKNPVLSCYQCRRFMPVSDVSVHEHVLDSLRPVVSRFAEAGGAFDKSPAYVQLSATIHGVQSTIAGLKKGEEEE